MKEADVGYSPGKKARLVAAFTAALSAGVAFSVPPVGGQGEGRETPVAEAPLYDITGPENLCGKLDSLSSRVGPPDTQIVFASELPGFSVGRKDNTGNLVVLGNVPPNPNHIPRSAGTTQLWFVTDGDGNCVWAGYPTEDPVIVEIKKPTTSIPEVPSSFLTEPREGFYESGPFLVPGEKGERTEFVRLETPSATFHFMGRDIRFIIDPDSYSRSFDRFLQTYNTAGTPIDIFIWDEKSVVTPIDSNGQNVEYEIQRRLQENLNPRDWFLGHSFFKDNRVYAGVNSQTGALELHVSLSLRSGADPSALTTIYNNNGSERVNVLILATLYRAFFGIDDINAPELNEFISPMQDDFVQGRASLPIAVITINSTA